MAVPLVSVPNVEKLVIDYLRPALTGSGHTVTVATNVPATRPAELVRVTVTGGELRDVVISESLVAVECWGPSPVAAGDLARECQALLNGWDGQRAGASFIYSCRARSPANFPDPDTRTPRYVFTAVLTLRAVDGGPVTYPGPDTGSPAPAGGDPPSAIDGGTF